LTYFLIDFWKALSALFALFISDPFLFPMPPFSIFGAGCGPHLPLTWAASAAAVALPNPAMPDQLLNNQFLAQPALSRFTGVAQPST